MHVAEVSLELTIWSGWQICLHQQQRSISAHDIANANNVLSPAVCCSDIERKCMHKVALRLQRHVLDAGAHAQMSGLRGT